MNLEQYLQQHYAASTAAAYYKEINNFLSNNPAAEKYTYQDLMQYIGQLRGRYKNTRTLHRILSAIKVYYKYLCAAGQRKDNPAKNIKIKDKRSRDIQLQDLFSSAELEHLLERKERYHLHAIRNKVLTGLLIYQALQPKEIAALQLSDIDIKAGTIHIKASAKANSRTLSLKAQQVMLLYQYMAEARIQLLKGKQHDFLIVGGRGNVYSADEISKHIKYSFRHLYSPRKITATSIRQSVIANLLTQGGDIRVVQVFAGHRNPSSTEQYKQSNVSALKEQIQKYHPIR